MCGKNEDYYEYCFDYIVGKVDPTEGLIVWLKAEFPEIKIVDEESFGDAFIDFLDDMHNKKVIKPNEAGVK